MRLEKKPKVTPSGHEKGGPWIQVCHILKIHGLFPDSLFHPVNSGSSLCAHVHGDLGMHALSSSRVYNIIKGGFWTTKYRWRLSWKGKSRGQGANRLWEEGLPKQGRLRLPEDVKWQLRLKDELPMQKACVCVVVGRERAREWRKNTTKQKKEERPTSELHW